MQLNNTSNCERQYYQLWLEDYLDQQEEDVDQQEEELDQQEDYLDQQGDQTNHHPKHTLNNNSIAF